MKLPTSLCFVVFSSVPVLAQPPPGFGGGVESEREILKQFDKDASGVLEKEERAAAREFLKANPAPRRGGPGGGRRGPGGFGQRENPEPPEPGARISPEDVKPESGSDLYAPDTLRTLFLDFENEDWEPELEAFHGTDVDVPAKLTVDGRVYAGTGVRFRGKSSYMMVPAGRKRSFNVSMDHSDGKQRLAGYKTLNLLNCNGDASMMSAALYSRIARKYIAAPKVNFVRVVINGENWGVYASQQQFNKDFVQENFRTSKGARWKVPGSPHGRGGLEYLGDDGAEYEEIYEMKGGGDEDQDALIRLCKTLSETPLDELEAALEPMLDLDSTLWFLALDVALMNSDGYWTRASDYTMYRDRDGRFHLVPHDMNEAFRAGGGPGGGRRPGGHGGGGGVGLRLDPLVGQDDKSKPLRSRLLAVPSLRKRYLENVRKIAEEDLDWKNLGPMVADYRELIGAEVAADTRKLATTEQFERITADAQGNTAGAPQGFGRGGMPLRAFADERRAYLLEHPAISALK